MGDHKSHPSVEFSFGESPGDYEHVSMMLSVPSDPMGELKIINESAANPAVLDVDRQIENLCKKYSTASEEQRVELRRIATNGWSLLHYSHRMAIRAMRTDNIDCIRLGFISLLLENGRSDPRDTICRLAMLCHAASRIKSDFAFLADEAMEISSPGIAECIREFVARDCDSQSLKMFALGETHDANGPRIDVGVF